MTTSGILFDFFGSLVEYRPGTDSTRFAESHAFLTRYGFAGSCEEALGVWESVFCELHVEHMESCAEFEMRQVADVFFEEVGVTVSAVELDQFVEIYIREWSTGVHQREGLRDLLLELSRSFRLGVVSNTHYAPLVYRHLDTIGVRQLFSTVLTSVEFGTRKPLPAIFERALVELGLERTAVIHVGDSFYDDYLGARAASIRCLLIDPQRAHEVPERDRIQSVFDLRGLV
jgi:putative hydrolase of the HAD superfamily